MSILTFFSASRLGAHRLPVMSRITSAGHLIADSGLANRIDPTGTDPADLATLLLGLGLGRKF